MATASKRLQHPGTVSYLHPTIIGVIASALLTLLVIVGSRNLEHFDSALFGYTVASVVAFGAIFFRYAIWLQRPATRHADRVIDKVVPTHCPYCAVQCGMNLLVEKNKVVGFEPRYDFPVNEGRLCPKGVTAYLQTHHPDRLLHPLIKRNGVFERAGWDEALDLIVAKFKEIQEKYGKDAIGIYSGSSLTTEKTYLMGKFARAGLGTRYIDYNGRLCMVSAAAGNNKAFGIDRAANP